MKSLIGYINKFTRIDKNWAVAEFFVLEKNTAIKISGNINSMLIENLYKIQIKEEPKVINDTKIYECKSFQLPIINNETFFKYLKTNTFSKLVDDDFINIVKSHYKSDDILKEILSDKDKFLDINQVGKHILNSIFNKLNNTNNFISLQSEFLGNGLDLAVFSKLIQLYGNSFDQLIKALQNFLYEINFKYQITSLESIDKIFLHFNNDANNVVRIAYYLHYYCDQILNEKSSTYTNLENLKKRFDDEEKFFIPLESNEQVINEAINYALTHKLLVIAKDKVYTTQTYNDEYTIALALTKKEKVEKINYFKFKRYINQIQDEVRKETKIENFKYDKSQINALRKFINNKFVVITGGPGTGKTTLIKGLVKLFKKVYPNESFRIATPTGRAAARIKEGFEESNALTIHKLLGYDVLTDKFKVDKNNPLNDGLLIIDETSMVDNNLFSHFISAIGKAKKVVFVGDIEQLPSIGIGNVFEDIIKSEKITTVELKSTHRQKEQSKIVELAYMIRNNNFSLAKLQETTENSDLKTIFIDEQDKCLDEILNNYHFENKNGFDIPYKIQIISPFNEGKLGIKEINKMVQDKLNPNKKQGLQANGYNFYNKDKIMYLKNETTLSNGDIGVVDSINKYDNKMNTNFNEKPIQINSVDINNLTLCYACTVHKTQGSEFQKVILVLDPKNNGSFVNKKLVYTAITRAKKELVIIASKQSFNRSVNQKSTQRDTTLTERIRQMYDKKR
ncbi:ATP-dependent DNA helicase [Mycoplasma mycoides]|uniref:ATP-dependent DNA helicase n=1 Tax=Mycoplasma mycoides TaxID=2102 RepID=UPI00034DE45F|nr:AAA family ATPase [Mycoplasma mycoides]EXU60557.1 Exodeoxyribonuclease V alpha subunit [Mycoplasma mycoides subsp. capri PG3]QVK04700.1 AAA family ATPase [Mycoplasma mycoides subsp. capri]